MIPLHPKMYIIAANTPPSFEQCLATFWMLIRGISFHQRELPGPYIHPTLPHLLEIHGLPFSFSWFPWRPNSLLFIPNFKPGLFLTLKLWARSQHGSSRCNDIYSHSSLQQTPSFLQLLGVESTLGDIALQRVLVCIMKLKLCWLRSDSSPESETMYVRPKQGKDFLLCVVGVGEYGVAR